MEQSGSSLGSYPKGRRFKSFSRNQHGRPLLNKTPTTQWAFLFLPLGPCGIGTLACQVISSNPANGLSCRRHPAWHVFTNEGLALGYRGSLGVCRRADHSSSMSWLTEAEFC